LHGPRWRASETMFEVGFTELLLIFALGLLVLGPEKLPKVASQVGRWLGRARAMARQFREQLEEEANVDVTAQQKRTYTPPPSPPPSDPYPSGTAPTPDTAANPYSGSAPFTASPSPTPSAGSAVHPEAVMYGSPDSGTPAVQSPAPSPTGSPEIDSTQSGHERGT
jgi:sec-independent protein translocase protein TatB